MDPLEKRGQRTIAEGLIAEIHDLKPSVPTIREFGDGQVPMIYFVQNGIYYVLMRIGKETRNLCTNGASLERSDQGYTLTLDALNGEHGGLWKYRCGGVHYGRYGGDSGEVRDAQCELGARNPDDYIVAVKRCTTVSDIRQRLRSRMS